MEKISEMREQIDANLEKNRILADSRDNKQEELNQLKAQFSNQNKSQQAEVFQVVQSNREVKALLESTRTERDLVVTGRFFFVHESTRTERDLVVTGRFFFFSLPLPLSIPVLFLFDNDSRCLLKPQI